MDLIERYLNEIGRRLPKAKRDDIRDELRSALDDALESRGAGEPGEDDTVAVLREFGPPAAVAASYGGSQYLIGPGLYPQFVTTLKVVVSVPAGLVVVGFALSLVGGSVGLAGLAERMGGLVNGLLDSVLTSVGIVVVVFALLERMGVAGPPMEKDWDPRKLPAVRDADLVSRFDSIAGMVFPAVILILINQFRDRVGLMVFAEGERFAAGVVSEPGGRLLLNDVFLDNLPWLNTSLLLGMASSAWLFWSGRWHWTTRLLKISFDLFGLYVVHRICQGVIAAGPELVAAGLPERLVAVLERSLFLLPVIVAGFVVYEAAKHLYHSYKSLA